MALLLGAAAALLVLDVWLAVTRRATLDEVLTGPPVAFAYGAAALVVARRRPENRVGHLLAVVAVGSLLSAVSIGYTESGPHPTTLPLGLLALWVGQWAYVVWVAVGGLLLPLLFPTGRLPSRRWRPALWLVLSVMAAGVLSEATLPTFTADSPGPGGFEVDNPIGLPAAVSDPFYAIGNALLLLCVPVAIGSLVHRVRSARGRERDQVRLVAWTLAVAIAGIALAVVASVIEPEGADPEGTALVVLVLGAVGWFTALAAIGLGLPIAMAVAIVRHRLYDIDVVINRTLVYLALTVLLLGTYLLGVLGLGPLLRPLAGDSDLAVAGSTLLVAALFRPLRTRVQRTVDRRFYRRKYDAERVLETFGHRLRQQVDLDDVADEVRLTLGRTVQPAEVSLWWTDRSRQGSR